MTLKVRFYTYTIELPIALLLIGCLFISTIVSAQVPPVGQWREHLNYQQTIQVVKGDQLYCATTKALFSIDNRDEITRYSKVTGLNDIGVRCIGWDAATSQLVIAYNNSNLDLLKGSIVYNISDVAKSTIAGDKSIQQIFCQNGLAYLSSGLGIIVTDLTRREIRDTWIIGNNGNQVKVNGFTIHNNLFYAATEEGLKTVSTTVNNPANYRNWTLVSGSNQLPSGSIKNVIIANNNAIVQKGDSLFIQNGTNWQLLYYDANWPIVSITAAGNQLTVCQRNSSGAARVLLLNTNGTIARSIGASGIISFPLSAIVDNGQIWVADRFGGLSRTTNSTDRFIPNGPPGVATGELASNGNITVATAGSVNDAWNYLFNRDGFYLLRDNNAWSSRSFFNTPVLDSVLDFITVAIDPRDEAIWAGSYGGGLVRFSNDQFTIFKQHNSSLRAAIGDPGSVRVSGLAFDSKQQLWVANYGAAQNLSVRKRDNNWKSFSIPFTHLENSISQLIIDDQDQIWAMSPKGNGLFCFNPGTDIDNIADDRWKYYRQGTGNGNLPSSNVFSIVKDRDGAIWVGTDRGIGIIRCPELAFSAAGCEAIQPIVQQDRFAGLLFRDEVVQCMAVDGANRKWVGTRNGLWLLSSNGEKVVYRFTAENSPLLSNDVRKLTIDPITGELFIATFEGLCSFRSTATEPAETQNKVLVFPNPVPPSFNGTIAIRGLVNKALVKITELNGRLVYQTRSFGGQAVWDGRNYLGIKVASGVYLVLIRDDSGEERIATKIVITSSR
jgi:ligand-binding sensor domain-containing protein